MKNTYKLLMVLLAVLVMSCEDEDAKPLFLYGDLETGTYIRLVDNSSNFLVDQNDFSSYTHTYTIEFVSDVNGSNVESYTADLVYKSGSADPRTAEDFVSLSSSEFTTNEDGFAEATITFTSAQLIGAFGLSEADLSPEDEFEFLGEIVTPTNTFNSVNSSATVEGAFFQGYFDFTVFVGCASNLAGEYTATTTAINCSTGNPGSASVTYTLEIEDTGNIAIGEYEFDDATFGVLADCFGDEDAVQGGFVFQDVCGAVSFTAVADEFGTNWTVSSVISGNDWIITWVNPDTGLGGETSINFPNGIDFTVD